MVEVILENLPQGIEKGTLQVWYFEEGDPVEKGDEIADLGTEEGSVTVTAPVSGILAEVYYDEGETVERGEILCLIEDKESLEEEEEEEKEE